MATVCVSTELVEGRPPVEGSTGRPLVEDSTGGDDEETIAGSEIGNVEGAVDNGAEVDAITDAKLVET